MAAGRQLTVHERLTLQEALNVHSMEGLVRFVFTVLKLTLAFELTGVLLKELGIGTIVAKAVTPLHGRILEKLGVSRVIFPEREMAIRVAHSLVMPNVIDYIELSKDFSIVELPAPPAFVGKTLK